MQILPVNFNFVQKYTPCSFKSAETLIYSDVKQKNEYYCAPAAAANSIITLTSSKNNSETLVEELAHIMHTDKSGTTSNNFCKGIEEYFNSKGRNIKIEYSGFRNVDKKYKTGELPDFEKIKNALKNNCAVVLNLGVYKKIGDKYIRQYGHFVNAVNAGFNGYSADKNSLSITDPYNKIGGLHYISLKPIESGKLIHNKDDNEVALTDNAKGFYEISPKFNYFEYAETAVLNGVIIISKI